MEAIVRPRQGGKTTDVLRLAHENFAYVVCPTTQDVHRLWELARERGLNIPQPITFSQFRRGNYYGRGIKGGFIIDDLDRCLQQMTTVEIKAVSLTGEMT